MWQICPVPREYETVLVALAPAVALLCVLAEHIWLCSSALRLPVCRSFAMPCLLDLGVDLLLRIAGLCDLESAGHLSLVNKQLSAVTPVLPSLCDVSRLQLYLPFGDNGSSGELPLHDM